VKVILINELKLLLGLASSSLQWNKASLSATACIGPGTLCTQGLTRMLTGSLIFRLVQQIPICTVVVKQDFAHLRFNLSRYVGHSNNLL